MCGISGILSPSLQDGEIGAVVDAMVNSIRHRGPDAKGVWTQPGIGLGHARLSVIDLSAAGAQPMRSQSGNHVLTYNGEIYNFQEIRKTLIQRGVQFSGNSDTEVLLEAIDLCGLDWTLKQAHGMFAIALWNVRSKTLTLARDRFGEKPLYYGLIDGDFVFASELTPFKQHPRFHFDIDHKAMSAYVKYQYVPSPMCILKGFKKLSAGHHICGKQPIELMEATPIPYWDPMDRSRPPDDYPDLDAVLSKVIKRQMISDVPIGSFLSGGLDSSLVTALMQKHSTKPINSFTIGFKEKDYDESLFAKKIADHLGTHHTEWIITQEDVKNVIPSMPRVFDEPFADASQLPTTLLSQLTRKSVTVCLSGDGGDELFAGYDRYSRTNKIHQLSSRVPSPIKKAFNKIYNTRDLKSWVATYKRINKLTSISVSNVEDKLYKLNQICSNTNPEVLYDSVLSYFYHPNQILVNGVDYSNIESTFSDQLSFIENMMLNDARHYLIDDIMVKVDRAAMSVGLESRAPFLDHEVYEYAWRLPLEEKLSNGQGKLPIRQLLSQYIPQELIDRPKKGFGVPLEHWFRTDLREWLQDSLHADSLQQQGIFKPEGVQQYVDEHLSGTSDRQHQLWTILSFQAWYEEWTN